MFYTLWFFCHQQGSKVQFYQIDCQKWLGKHTVYFSISQLEKWMGWVPVGLNDGPNILIQLTGCHWVASSRQPLQQAAVLRDKLGDQHWPPESSQIIFHYSNYIPTPCFLSLPLSPSLSLLPSLYFSRSFSLLSSPPAWLVAGETWRTVRLPTCRWWICAFSLFSCVTRWLARSLVPRRPADVSPPWSNHGAGRAPDIQDRCGRGRGEGGWGRATLKHDSGSDELLAPPPTGESSIHICSWEGGAEGGCSCKDMEPPIPIRIKPDQHNAPCKHLHHKKLAEIDWNFILGFMAVKVVWLFHICKHSDFGYIEQFEKKEVHNKLMKDRSS